MATVSVSASLKLSGAGQVDQLSGSLAVTPVGTDSTFATQTIGTSSELVVMGDVTTIGYFMVKNNDETNFVLIDNVTSFDNWPQKLLPGQFILLKPQAATIYAKADTASCQIAYGAVEV
jgi:hypothetical protein